MVRHYVRKTNRVGIRSEEVLQRARDLIPVGKSISQTAGILGIPLSTLRDTLKNVAYHTLCSLLHYSTRRLNICHVAKLIGVWELVIK